MSDARSVVSGSYSLMDTGVVMVIANKMTDTDLPRGGPSGALVYSSAVCKMPRGRLCGEDDCIEPDSLGVATARCIRLIQWAKYYRHPFFCHLFLSLVSYCQ